MRIPWRASISWARFWMQFSGMHPSGRAATWLATLSMPPYNGRRGMALMSKKGYISPRATIYGEDLWLGANIYIDDYVLIYQGVGSGPVSIANGVQILRGTIIQTGGGGSISIGTRSCIQPNCQFSAHGKGMIQIGSGVQIAPKCAFYPYDHGIAPGELVSAQPLKTKGGIIIEDDAWLGVGVIVLDGVRIGKGAVIAAGSVVSRDVPDGAIAAGVPARVVKMRSELVD